MKINLNILIACPYGVYKPGQEADLPDNIAIALVEGGYATALDPSFYNQEPEGSVEYTSIAPKKTRKKK